MSYWKIVVPETTETLFANPSFETNTTGWTMAGAGAAATRGTTHQKFGAYGVLLNPAAADMQYYESITVAAVSHTLSVFARNAAGTAVADLTLWFNNASVAAATTTDLGDGWYRLDYTATPTGGARQFGVQVAANAADVHVDAFQLEAKAYRTTYCDGDQEGCRWELGAHSSQSVRSAQSRAGGRVYDLDDDYGLEIGDIAGAGMFPVKQVWDEYAIIAGGYTQSYKAGSLVFILSGVLTGTSYSNLHDKRLAIIPLLSPGGVPNNQPFLIRYTGGTVTKEILARYEAGLELGLSAREPKFERVAIRFLATDPFWRSIGETADTLDTNDTDTLRYCAGRLGGLGHATGQWDDLGLTNNPGANGTIWAVLAHSNGYVYYGGDFTNHDQTGDGRDYLVAYNPEADTWSRCGGANDLNGIVYDLVETPIGDLLVCGAFTDAGAVGAADYVAIYDISAGTWSALGTPESGTITSARCAVYDLDGLLHVGWDGTNIDGIADADYLATWDGTNWAAIGTGFDALPHCCALDKTTGFIWWGGEFTVADGEAVVHICTYYDGAQTPLGNLLYGGASPGGIVYDIAITDAGTVYICGATFGFKRYRRGEYWVSMSSSITGTPYVMALGPDDMLYAGGTITDIDGLEVKRLARWNGTSWSPIDILLPGAPTVYAIDAGVADPIHVQNHDLYIGFTTTGAGYFAGTTTVNHGGSFLAYPEITINRSGGTSAELVQIRNETLGAVLPCAYDLLDGETVTIGLKPANRTIKSSMFGRRMDIVLTAADFGRFALQQGDNQITCFVDVVGATVTANIVWRTTYASLD